MKINKFYALTLCLSAMIPAGVARASLDFPVYGQNNNPIYVTPVLTQQQKNELKKSQLQSAYGIQAYNRCNNTYSCERNMDFPLLGAMCLGQIEACLQIPASSDSGYQPSAPSYSAPSCPTGYVPQNGSCVTPDQGCQKKNGSFFAWSGKIVNGQYECVCKLGFTFDTIKNACVPALCPLGQGWDGTQCISYATQQKSEPTPTNETNSCQQSYGSNVIWTGTVNSDGAKICDCIAGSTWNTSRTACMVSTSSEVIIAREKASTIKIDQKIIKKYSGKLVLQEDSGTKQVWYVSPKDSKRYFIGSSSDLMSLVQKQAKYLKGSQVKAYKKRPAGILGYFIVDTTTWDNLYANPKDGKMYVINAADGSTTYDQAFQLLDTKAVSISTSDARKISVGLQP